VGILRSALGYTFSEPVNTTVAGVPAIRLDVQVNLDDPIKKAAYSGVPDGTYLFDIAPLFGIPSGGFGRGSLHKGNAGRLYVADVLGKTVNILIEAPIAEFDTFASQAEAVLATVTF
jgi:hypothetical protein